MARRLWIALALALSAPALTFAQPAPGPQLLEARLDGAALELLVRCPPGPPGPLALSVDGAPLPPATPAPAGPPALALLVEAGPAMDGPGTPLSTRRRDAAALAAALVEQMPEAGAVTLIAFDDGARSLARNAGPAAALGALAGPPASPVDTTAAGLAAALREAGSALAAAPPGPRAAVLMLAAPPPADAALLRGLLPPHTALTLVELGAAGDSGAAAAAPLLAAALGAERLVYTAAELAEAPALLSGAAAQIVASLDPASLTRLRAGAGQLAPGWHSLRVEGCGGAASSSLWAPAAPAPVLPIWPAGLAAGALGLGLGLAWRRSVRRGGPRPQPHAPLAGARPDTARFGQAAHAPTERHEQALRLGGPFELIVLDGQQSQAHGLVGRSWTLGRDEGCDIRIGGESVSGLHARLALADDRWELTDLGSTGGTFVGPQRRRLAADAPEAIEPGVPAWLGPAVEIGLRAVEAA